MAWERIQRCARSTRECGTAGLFALLLGCGGSEPATPDVLLITLDTTRADALGAYGRSPSPTPGLDSLAGQSLRFHEAMTVAPLTLAAHSSVLTGRYPDRTGLRDNAAASLPPDIDTLAERLRGAGWHTGAFVSAAVLDSSFGLDQGFEVYVDDFDPTRSELEVQVAERPAGETIDAALAWWRTLDAGPRMTWVHLYDPHSPLRAPEPFASDWADPYLAEVAYLDAQVQRLLAQRRDGYTVVLGDHGEGNGQHGERYHGVFVYRSTMRVPLLLQGPGVTPGVVEHVVSLVDVAPTLLELLGLSPLEEADGRSLLADEPRGVYGESVHGMHQFGFAPLAVWQDETRRYIEAPRPELYGWRTDPGERSDLWLLTPDGAPARALAAFREGREPVVPAVAEADLSAQLAALGYLTGPSMVPAGELADPKDHPDIVARTEALIIAARTRPPAEAVPLLRAFLEEYPGVGVAWALLARALGLAGEHAQAIEVLERLHQQRPDDPMVLQELGEQLMALERWGDAEDRLQQAVALRPADPVAHGLLAEAARRQGSCARARTHWEAGLAASPDASRLWLVRAVCAEQQGELQAAKSDYDAVLDVEPDNADALQRRALLAASLGEADALERLEALGSSSSAEVAHRRGLLLYEAGRYADAADALRPLWSTGLLDAHGLRVLADALLRSGGSRQDVGALLEQAAMLAPLDPEVLAVQAQLLMEQGRVDEAIETQRRARELLAGATTGAVDAP